MSLQHLLHRDSFIAVAAFADVFVAHMMIISTEINVQSFYDDKYSQVLAADLTDYPYKKTKTREVVHQTGS